MNKRILALLQAAKEESTYLHIDFASGCQYYVCALCGEQAFKGIETMRHRSDCLCHKLTRAIYQATFPRIGANIRPLGYYSNRYYTAIKTERLPELIRNERWNLQVRRSGIAKALKGGFHRTPAQVRERLAQEEIHYYKLVKELAWRTKLSSHAWLLENTNSSLPR